MYHGHSPFSHVVVPGIKELYDMVCFEGNQWLSLPLSDAVAFVPMAAVFLQCRTHYGSAGRAEPRGLPGISLYSVCRFHNSRQKFAGNVQYLVESIRKFPNQDEFAAMIKRAGFSVVSYQNLTFGVVAIHSGFKLAK